MAIIHTITGATPPARYDALPWDRARVEESVAEDGPWAEVDTLTLDPVDADPSAPATRGFTFPSDLTVGYFRIVWLDAEDNSSAPTAALYDDGISGPPPPPPGTYTTVEALKAYTGLTALIAADDLWLANAIIPVAEGLLVYHFGPFTDEQAAHPLVALSANILAEYLFESNPLASRNQASSGAFQSESLGSYSYSRGAVDAVQMTEQLRGVLERISALLALIPGWRKAHPDVVIATEVVFPTLPGYERDPNSGELISVFDPHLEAEPHGPRLYWR